MKAAPGNKFLRHLGSLCARAHPENNQEGSDIERTKPRRRKIMITVNLQCIVDPSKYMIDVIPHAPEQTKSLALANMQISSGQTDFTTISVAERPPDQRRGRPSFPRWFSEDLGGRNDDCDHQYRISRKTLAVTKS